MRVIIPLAAMLILFSPYLMADEGHHHQLSEQEIGAVNFETSCAKSVRTDFNHAVALLHSFQYEQARGMFADIARRDPTCAMARWGIAMSHYHGLWGNGDTAAGRNALREAQAIAGANSITTPREKLYIEALAEIYRDDDQGDYQHAQAFEAKMGALQAGYPADTEGAIFHALSLAITAPKTDKTFANQRKCGEILQPIFERQPQHPGVAHYLIHCYDNPVLAASGLNAARHYATIAPASAHANHMPAHIFTRMGLWDESIASNRRSAELAAGAEATSSNGEARDQRLHAMDYLEYAYLQTGRVQEATAVLEEMNSLRPVSGLTLTGDYALAAIPARYAIETRNWKQASGLQVRSEGVPWAQAITWAAIGVGSARSGNTSRANEAEQALASLRDATAKQNNTYWSNQVEVQRREVAAWVANARGKSGDAVAMLRSAAQLEESMDKHAVTPGAVTPAREMLADLLALQKKFRDSVIQYAAVLKVAPGRFNAVYGAAATADAADDEASARRYFKQLLQTGVGEERPEMVTARKKLAISTSSRSTKIIP